MTEQEQADALWLRVYEAWATNPNSYYNAVDRADKARREWLSRHEREAEYAKRMEEYAEQARVRAALGVEAQS